MSILTPLFSRVSDSTGSSYNAPSRVFSFDAAQQISISAARKEGMILFLLTSLVLAILLLLAI